MIDIKFLRENPEAVKENIKKKFQDSKLPLVDEVIELDKLSREAKGKADSLRANRNKLSKQIGGLFAQGKKEEAEQLKAQVAAQGEELAALEAQETELSEKVTKIMMTIPNIIDDVVPIGKGKRLLLSYGRYRKTSQRRNQLCARLYDKPRFYLLCSAVYDPLKCSYRRYELCRNGRYDV